MAADHVVAFQVVKADGRFITASKAEKLTYSGPFVVVEAGRSLS
jgi:hypothetical protein